MTSQRIFKPTDPDFPTSDRVVALLKRQGRIALETFPPAINPLPQSKPKYGFGASELALIKRLHAIMPAVKLLELLNERRRVDGGAEAVGITLEELQDQIGTLVAPDGSGVDWAALRKLLAAAHRSGVLDAITEQVLDDFAVVFSCSPKQLVTLKEIVLGAKEDRL